MSSRHKYLQNTLQAGGFVRYSHLFHGFSYFQPREESLVRTQMTLQNLAKEGLNRSSTESDFITEIRFQMNHAYLFHQISSLLLYPFRSIIIQLDLLHELEPFEFLNSPNARHIF